MADTNEFKPRPCHHCGAAHGHFTDCLHKYERAIATAPDLGGLWALCNYFSRMKATPPADAALADLLARLDAGLGTAHGVREALSAYRKLCREAAAALRARAVPVVLNDAIGRLLVAADNLSYEPGTVGGIAELQDAADELGRAMLAASKSGDQEPTP